MLRNHVIDERDHGVEAQQHEQPFTNKDGDRPIAQKKVSHNKTVYTQEASR